MAQDKKTKGRKKLEEFTDSFFDNLISRAIKVLREGPERNKVRKVKSKVSNSL